MQSIIEWEKLLFGAKDKVKYRKLLTYGVIVSTVIMAFSGDASWPILSAHCISAGTTLMWIWE